MGNLPVGNGDVFGENVLHAGNGEEAGGALDNIQIADHSVGGDHGDGFLLTVNNDGANVGGKAVRGHQRGNGHKGNAQLIGAVAAKVHQSTGANHHDHIGLALQPGHHILNHALLGMESLSLQDNLLVRLHVDHSGQMIGVGVVDHGAEAAKTAIVHILIEVVQRAILTHHQLRPQLMHTAAVALTKVFRSIQYHGKTSV